MQITSTGMLYACAYLFVATKLTLQRTDITQNLEEKNVITCKQRAQDRDLCLISSETYCF